MSPFQTPTVNRWKRTRPCVECAIMLVLEEAMRQDWGPTRNEQLKNWIAKVKNSEKEMEKIEIMSGKRTNFPRS